MNKLYIVKTKMPSSSKYKNCYVVAEDTIDAYTRVKDYLDKKHYGFSKERALESITLIAEDYDYTNCESMLFS